MSEKSNYEDVRRVLYQCTVILKQIRVDELDDAFEDREDYAILSKQSDEVCNKLKESLDEKQHELLNRYIDLNVDMYSKRGLYYYIHGFEDCQNLYKLFKDLSEGRTSIPKYNENEVLNDWTAYIESLSCSQNIYKSVLEISKRLDDFLLENEKNQKS